MATIPNKMRLTKIAIAALPAPDADATVWDHELSGFGLRLLPSGARTFILQRRTKAGRSDPPEDRQGRRPDAVIRRATRPSG